ncbi:MULTISPECIES: response regulator [unclassified Bradyrhizobium]
MQGLLRILVVEDDHLIAEMVREALAEGGFETEIVASGQEALALFDDDRKYRALVTDINLQGELTGWQVAQRARESFADLPVVYMTGAAADEWASHGVPNSVLLTKPFAPAQVVTAVSQLLNDTPPLPSG